MHTKKKNLSYTKCSSDAESGAERLNSIQAHALLRLDISLYSFPDADPGTEDKTKRIEFKQTKIVRSRLQEISDGTEDTSESSAGCSKGIAGSVGGGLERAGGGGVAGRWLDDNCGGSVVVNVWGSWGGWHDWGHWGGRDNWDVWDRAWDVGVGVGPLGEAQGGGLGDGVGLVGPGDLSCDRAVGGVGRLDLSNVDWDSGDSRVLWDGSCLAVSGNDGGAGAGNEEGGSSELHFG